MAQVHPLLTRAKALAEEFAVRPHGRGFVIWRLRPWDHARPGWKPDAYASTRTSAEAQILSRFPGLEPDIKPDTETPPVPAVIWDFYGGMWP